MKKMIYLWAALALPLLFVACSDDKNDDPVDPVLKFKEAEVIADPAGVLIWPSWNPTSHGR